MREAIGGGNCFPGNEIRPPGIVGSFVYGSIFPIKKRAWTYHQILGDVDLFFFLYLCARLSQETYANKLL